MDIDRMESLFHEHRFIAVLRTGSAEEALRAGRAVLAGGARMVEVTLTVPDALRVLKELRASAPPGCAVGVGTALSPEDLEAALGVGADFAISPDVNPEVIRRARERGLFHVPGAMTPTEVTAAVRAGARAVKIFPIASLGGPAHVRALRGPLPRVPLLVTGGVDLDTLAEFFAAGATAVGLTTTLILPEALARGDDARITALTRDYVARLAAIPARPR